MTTTKTITESSSEDTVELTSYTAASGMHTLVVQLANCGGPFQFGDGSTDLSCLSLELPLASSTLTLTFQTASTTWPSNYVATVSKGSTGAKHSLPHTFDSVSPTTDFHVTITPTTGSLPDVEPIGWDPKIKVVAPSRGGGE